MDASRSHSPRNRNASLKTALCLTLVFTQAAPLWAGPPLFKRIFAPHQAWGKKPDMNEDYALELTAKNIDWLEHQIDYYGTIVAKVPDVWGEARLTKYRREVEEQLSQEVDDFDKEQINGAQFVSDSFRLAAALSLGVAQTTTGTGADATPVQMSQPNVTVNSAGAITMGSADPTDAANATVPSITTQTTNAYTPLRNSGIFDSDAGENALVFNGNGIQVEQVAVLDQHKRYLDHLNQLRRLNEGDDTADAPGYSMSLVRVPVSVLPGTATKQGYGAEITMTATPEIDDKMLLRTFQDLVINDLVDQLSLPIVRLLNSDPLSVRQLAEDLSDFATDREVATKSIELLKQNIDALKKETRLISIVETMDSPFFGIMEENKARIVVAFRRPTFESVLDDPDLLKQVEKDLQKLHKALQEPYEEELAVSTAIQDRLRAGDLRSLEETEKKLLERVWQLEQRGSQSIPSTALPPLNDAILGSITTTQMQAAAKTLLSVNSLSKLTASLPSTIKSVASARTAQQKILTWYERFAIPGRTSRRSTLPFPVSQLIDNYGQENFERLFVSLYNALSRDAVNREVFHLQDVQGILRDELTAAYRLLERPEVGHVWQIAFHEADGIVREVRQRQIGAIEERRSEFSSTLSKFDYANRNQLSRCLAWMVYLDSILLNDEFNKQLEDYVPECTEQWYAFFGPKPGFEAIDAFTRYAMARWPLKIFTVDPVNTEQNIADVSIIYREMQLAVALSVASGNMGVGAAMNALRQIQRETATIDLNRIAVGFSHGDDTFGWRFYPRFQTPPVESNLTTFFRDAIVGGPTDKHLEMKKEIEPGMRECVALIIMPSFIKGVSIDSRSNWFRLDKPGHTAMSMQDTMKFSRAVEQMRRNVEQCVCNQHLYRPGEVTRVLNRVRQLDRELPMQTHSCQVPIENVLGGFELLSSGTRELAPELLGWYGAPGYDQNKGGTFFLVGNNFSVHETRLIAGGTEISRRGFLPGSACDACREAVNTALTTGECAAATECKTCTKCTGGDGGACEKCAECTTKCNVDALLNQSAVTLISRDVMQVTLPPSLPVVRDFRLQNLPKGTLIEDPKEHPQYGGYVDVHVATPYGVSGHLLIPVVCPQDVCKTLQTSRATQPTPAKKVDSVRLRRKERPLTHMIVKVERDEKKMESKIKRIEFKDVVGLSSLEVRGKSLPAAVDVRAVFKSTDFSTSVGSILYRDVPILDGVDKNTGVVDFTYANLLEIGSPNQPLWKVIENSKRLMEKSAGVDLAIKYHLEGSGVDGGRLVADGYDSLAIRTEVSPTKPDEKPRVEPAAEVAAVSLIGGGHKVLIFAEVEKQNPTAVGTLKRLVFDQTAGLSQLRVAGGKLPEAVDVRIVIKGGNRKSAIGSIVVSDVPVTATVTPGRGVVSIPIGGHLQLLSDAEPLSKIVSHSRGMLMDEAKLKLRLEYHLEGTDVRGGRKVAVNHDEIIVQSLITVLNNENGNGGAGQPENGQASFRSDTQTWPVTPTWQSDSSKRSDRAWTRPDPLPRPSRPNRIHRVGFDTFSTP